MMTKRLFSTLIYIDYVVVNKAKVQISKGR